MSGTVKTFFYFYDYSWHRVESAQSGLLCSILSRSFQLGENNIKVENTGTHLMQYGGQA